MKKAPKLQKLDFLKSKPQKLSFQFLNFKVGSIFRKLQTDIFIGFRKPLVALL